MRRFYISKDVLAGDPKLNGLNVVAGFKTASGNVIVQKSSWQNCVIILNLDKDLQILLALKGIYFIERGIEDFDEPSQWFLNYYFDKPYLQRNYS